MPVKPSIRAASRVAAAAAVAAVALPLTVSTVSAGAAQAQSFPEGSAQVRVEQGRAADLPPYLDPTRPAEERAADLVSRMTLAEKAAQLSTTNAPAIDRLGVDSYAYWSEAQHGLSALYGGYAGDDLGITTLRATSFPTNLSMSLTWDPGLIRRATSFISEEARGLLDKRLYGTDQNNIGDKRSNYGHLIYWAPTVNMLRDPRWGREDEAFGEDPLLTGDLGAAWVQGFQGMNARGTPKDRYLKAIATLKHYAANNTEFARTSSSSDMDVATLRDYYTAQFRRVVEKSSPGGAMSSYNAINGTPSVANSFLLNVLLRRTFGFDGYVTSDCGAIQTQYRSAKPSAPVSVPTVSALTGIGGGHDWAPPGFLTDHGDAAAHWIRVEDGTVLRAQAGATAYGLRAGTTLNCVGASEQGPSAGYFGYSRPIMGEENKLEYVQEAIDAGVLTEGAIDRRLVAVFTQRFRTGEFDPVADQTWTHLGRDQVEKRSHRRLAGRAATEALTLLQNKRMGERGRLLPVSPARIDSVVVLGDLADRVFLGGYSGAPSEQISLLAGLRRRLPDAHILYDSAQSSSTAVTPAVLSSQTRAAIAAADLVVVMVGTDEGTNTEGSDRSSIALPGNYPSLVEQVSDVGNPRIALVVQSSGPVGLEVARTQVPAILYSAANGQRQGLAAADVLLGRHAPGGHLSFTWYADDSQLPSIANYALRPSETDGLGRTYRYFAGDPTYPFGFGRSYTRFRWSGVHLSEVSARPGDSVTATVKVENVGRRPGSDVVQWYAVPPARRRGSDDPELRRRLVGFSRTRTLAPGESQLIRVRIDLADALRHWDPRGGRSAVTPGRWRIFAGRDSAHRAGSKMLDVHGPISRSVTRLTLAPDRLVLRAGTRIGLLGDNPWMQGLPPVGLSSAAVPMLTAVRADDSFADATGLALTWSSSDPSVLTVDDEGRVHALRAGVATVTARLGASSASAPLVVAE